MDEVGWRKCFVRDLAPLGDAVTGWFTPAELITARAQATPTGSAQRGRTFQEKGLGVSCITLFPKTPAESSLAIEDSVLPLFTHWLF